MGKQVSITGKCDTGQKCTFKMPSGMSKFHFKTKQTAITFSEVNGKAKAFPTQLKLNKSKPLTDTDSFFDKYRSID